MKKKKKNTKKNDLIRENKQEKKKMIYTYVHSITVINGWILIKKKEIFQDDKPVDEPSKIIKISIKILKIFD